MGIKSTDLEAAVRRFVTEVVDENLNYVEDFVNEIPGAIDMTNEEWDTAVEDFKRLAREKARN